MGRVSGSNLSKVKRQNKRMIKEVLYKHAPISRSQIAEMLSLTPPTITTNVAEMIALGLVRELSAESGREECSPGRKPVDIDFVPESRHFLGVEIAPGRMRACFTNLRGKVLRQDSQPITDIAYAAVLAQLCQMVQDIIQSTGMDASRIFGLGIGVPGFVKSSQGLVRSSPRFGWEDRHLAADIQQMLCLPGLPVRVENNARARSVGEGLISGKPRPETYAYYFVSKGIACPLVINNSVFSGQTAGAGEVGHMVVDIDGPVCDSCGNRGCLEAFSSETAILRRAREAAADNADSLLRDTAKDPQNPTLEEVLEAAACGDRVIGKILRTATRYLAVSLANIINFISPELVIVDAYMMSREEWRTQFLAEVRQNLYGLNDTEVQLEFKPYDEFGGAKGAAAVAIREFFIKEAE